MRISSGLTRGMVITPATISNERQSSILIHFGKPFWQSTQGGATTEGSGYGRTNWRSVRVRRAPHRGRQKAPAWRSGPRVPAGVPRSHRDDRPISAAGRLGTDGALAHGREQPAASSLPAGDAALGGIPGQGATHSLPLYRQYGPAR